MENSNRTDDRNAPADNETSGNEIHKTNNPFEKGGPSVADQDQMEEDAAAEQQRKEALTERD
ncbi:MAG TPA: hypothetical protein VM935_11665 [Chitinophagaceae bacterium]|nr:hypothetical protein [Chitinophagaceae bacterium]